LSETTLSNALYEKFSEIASYFSSVSKVKKQVDRALKNLTNGKEA
jgi:hypothetical protein